MNATARAYDLSTPAPLPRDVERRLDTQREILAEGMRIHVRRMLRQRVEVTVGVPDVVRVRQFADFHSGRAWWFTGGSKADAAGRSVLLGCAPDLVYAAIDRQLGGTGQASATGRPPTAIEFQFGMRFVRDLFVGLSKAMALPPAQLEFAPERALTEPLITFMPDLQEPFARIPWKVKLHDREHELLLCVACRLLRTSESRPEKLQSSLADVQPSVASSPLELIAELARCRLTLDEAATIAPGDVISFDLPPGEPIVVRMQGKPRFRAKLGTHGGRYALSITELLDASAAEPSAPKAAPKAVAPGKAQHVSRG